MSSGLSDARSRIFIRLTSDTFRLSSTSAELSVTTARVVECSTAPVTALMTSATPTRKPVYLSWKRESSR
jgi:hypothetical protein